MALVLGLEDELRDYARLDHVHVVLGFELEDLPAVTFARMDGHHADAGRWRHRRAHPHQVLRQGHGVRPCTHGAAPQLGALHGRQVRSRSRSRVPQARIYPVYAVLGFIFLM